MATEDMSEIHLIRQNTAPSLKFTFTELMDICLIIRGAIGSLLETSKPGHARSKQLRALIWLYRRLMSIPPCATGIAFLLSPEEITLLDTTIMSCCAFARDNLPPALLEREETLQGLERMREELLQLLA